MRPLSTHAIAASNMADELTALEKFAARRAEARRRIFGAPITPDEWEKADADEKTRRLDPNRNPQSNRCKSKDIDDGQDR